MQVELYCPSCVSEFDSELDDADDLICRMVDDGAGLDLGDGATFEDQLSLRLQDGLECPCCGGPVELLQSSLGRLSLQLLTQW